MADLTDARGVTEGVVRFTAPRLLGVLAQPDDASFVHGVYVGPGDLGFDDGPHPSPALSSWRMIRVKIDGRVYFCPVNPSQVEAVTG